MSRLRKKKNGQCEAFLSTTITLKDALETQDQNLRRIILLCSDISLAILKQIPRAIKVTTHTNVYGEKDLEIDSWSSDALNRKLARSGLVRYFASEELEQPTENKTGEFTVVTDPIDGSSNVETDNLMGTIIGIYRDVPPPAKGRQLSASMYFLYGPYLELVLALEDGVREFYGIGTGRTGAEKFVWHGELARIPEQPSIYGVGGLGEKWTRRVRDFVEILEKRGMKLRYGGSLVGDFNQILKKGGFFAYPELIDSPQGKYRLQFEGNPIAFIAEKAGGKASSGTMQILDIEPTDITQRVPFYVGNASLVREFEELIEREGQEKRFQQ